MNCDHELNQLIKNDVRYVSIQFWISQTMIMYTTAPSTNQYIFINIIDLIPLTKHEFGYFILLVHSLCALL